MRDSNGRLLPIVAVLALLTVFAVGCLGILLEGAGIYKRLTDRIQTGYESRTCVQYIATKLRQTQAEVTVKGETLVLSEVLSGKVFETRIYCHEGWLMELFVPAEGNFEPEAGKRLLELAGMEPVLENGLLTVTLENEDGSRVQLRLALRQE